MSRRLELHTGEVRLVGERHGDADDPPVLLLHGGGQTRHSWASTAAALAERGWQAITLDARGHGESDWHPEGDYRLAGFAADVAAFAATLHQPPVLVGASLGGLTALLLEGEQRPGTSRGVVLVDVVPRLERAGTDRIQEFMTDRLTEGFASLEEAAAAIAAYNPHREPPRDLGGLAKNLRQGGDGRWYWHWDPRFTSGDRGPGEISDLERMRRACRGLAVPVLVVRGRMSDVVSHEGVASFLEDCPRARFEDVTGAGHMVAGDRNDAFTEVVVSFLESIVGAGGGGR